jgi:putative autotransporter adhesin-like protein
MKTKILSFALLIAVLTGSAKITSAAVAAHSDYTVLNDIKAINKVEVYGNVQLYISNNPAEQVTVYNKYYSKNALVQNRNGVLRISSYGAEKLVVWVNSENLQSVSAYDNAEISSFGNVSRIEFDIDLHDNATAKLQFDAFSVHATLRDNASAEFSGRVQEFGINRDMRSMVATNGLSVGNNTENSVTTPVQKAKEVLVGA